MKAITSGLIAAVIAATCASASAQWAKEPNTFFGVPLGQPIDVRSIPACDTGSTLADTQIAVCARRFTDGLVVLGGFPLPQITKGYASLWDGKVSLMNVKMEHADYGALRDMLIERYGKPTKTEARTVQNRMGVKFSNERVTWDGQHVRLRLIERDDRVDSSAIIIEHKATFAAEVSDMQKQKAAGSEKF